MSTISVQSLSAAATSQNVTLPAVPELFDPNFLDILIPPQAAPEPTAEGQAAPALSNAMMNALRSTAHQKLTTNAAPTFSSTLVPTLDAFLGLQTGLSGESIERYLRNSWEEDPELTLRIIWGTRSIHDGKGEKELFYRAFGWLLETHPRTAISNLHLLVEPVCLTSSKAAGKKRQGTSHGYWKDLLNILAMATLEELRPRATLHPRSNFLHNYYDGHSRPAFKNNQEQEKWSREQRVKRFEHAHERLTRKLLDDKRFRALYIAIARLFADQLAKDFDTMQKISALPRDATEERLEPMYSLSLAAKWAPTPGGAHDRVTNIVSAICLLLHEAQVSSSIAHRIPSHRDVTPLEMHLLRSFYQKHVLTRGRRLSCVPELLMSLNCWSKIIYTRVASVCMSKNKEKFFTHDEQRFMDYLKDVESGKKQISGATLLPHVLVQEALQLYRDTQFAIEPTRRLAALREQKARLADAKLQVVNAQWATLLRRLRESGQLDNSIAVCDVSGSMGTLWTERRGAAGKNPFDVEPIWPAVALSLLVARLAKPPFNDAFITFSATPTLVTLDPESARMSLGETVMSISKASWGANTDFNAVFLDLVLPLAIKHKVPKDQMIKRIFVFSDMQFDEARDTRPSRNTRPSRGTRPLNLDQNGHIQAQAKWETNHDVIAKAYKEAGYDVPELVYWNLSNAHADTGITAPVTGERQGVALLSGWSPSLLKVFMDVEEEEEWEVLDKEGQPEREVLTPEEVMKKALGRRSFDGLRVVD